MFLKLARLALHNLLRARARLAMTAGGVLVGTTAVILLIALTNGLQQAAESGIGQSGSLTELTVMPSFMMETGAGGAEPPRLTPTAVNGFWRIPGVALVAPLLNLRAQAELRTGDLLGFAQITGLDPRLVPYMGWNATEGVLALEAGGVLVGSQVATAFYDPESETFEPVTVDVVNARLELRLTGSDGGTRRIDLSVAGVLAPNPTFDFTIVMPVQTVADLNTWAEGGENAAAFTFDSVLVRAADREQTEAVTEAVQALGFSASGLGDFIAQINGFFGTMRLALGGVGGVALLVAAFGVANTMTMAILERTREIGLMKAVGATDGDILTIFLVEAALVGLSGGVAGIALSLILERIVNEALRGLPAGEGGIGFFPVDLSQVQGSLLVITPDLMLFGLVLAASVGIVAGLFPALRAARMLTVTALKSQ
jgi:putative ABC transport system permease protein